MIVGYDPIKNKKIYKRRKNSFVILSCELNTLSEFEIKIFFYNICKHNQNLQ